MSNNVYIGSAITRVRVKERPSVRPMQRVLIALVFAVIAEQSSALAATCDEMKGLARTVLNQSKSCVTTDQCARFDTECGCWEAVNLDSLPRVQKAWDAKRETCKSNSTGLFVSLCDYFCHVGESIECQKDRCTRVRGPEAAVETPMAVKQAEMIEAGDSVAVKLIGPLYLKPGDISDQVYFDFAGPLTGTDRPDLSLPAGRLVARAQASAIDNRVVFRLKKYLIQLNEKSFKPVEVSGFIVGLDGLRGIEAKLQQQERIDPANELSSEPVLVLDAKKNAAAVFMLPAKW